MGWNSNLVIRDIKGRDVKSFFNATRAIKTKFVCTDLLGKIKGLEPTQTVTELVEV